MKRALVIGGGFAGCAAAWELAQGGWRVTLLEQAPRLGGRGGAFHHPKLGLDFDCGQHLFLGAYSECLRLFKAWGAPQDIHFDRRLRVPYFFANETRVLESRFPGGPLGLALGLWRSGLLNGRAKLDLIRFGWAALLELLDPRGLDDLSAYDWLTQRGVGPEWMKAFWEPLILAVMNGRPEAVSAEWLAESLKQGFFKSDRAAALGFPPRPLSAYLDPLVASLSKRGSDVRFNVRVSQVKINGPIKKAILEDGREFEAEAMVLALPAVLAQRVLGPEMSARLGVDLAAALPRSPILTAHLFTAQPILPDRLGVLTNSGDEHGFEWGFDLTQTTGQRGPQGEYWSAFLVSGAEILGQQPQEQVFALLDRQLTQLFKHYRSDSVTQRVLLKEMSATPLFVPGSASARLPQATRISGLALAGDWTNTRLPATLEGAVRSGIAAAGVLS